MTWSGKATFPNVRFLQHKGTKKSQGPQVPEKIPTKSKKKANKSKLKSLPAPWAQNPAPWDKNQTCRTYSWGAPI